MTVGELIYQQMKDGYIPTAPLSDGFISAVTRSAEESQKLVETLRIPMENMQKTFERMRPQLEAMNNIILRSLAIAPSFIPSLYEEQDEDLILPALKGSVQEYVVEDADANPVRVERAISSYLLLAMPSGVAHVPFPRWTHCSRLAPRHADKKKFTYTEMGFVNEKTMLPDRKWKCFERLLIVVAHSPKTAGIAASTAISNTNSTRVSSDSLNDREPHPSIHPSRWIHDPFCHSRRPIVIL